MKSVVLAICIGFLASAAWAIDVSQIVFTITSSAYPSTANVRVTPMAATMAKDTSKTPLQTFVWRAGLTTNYFVTKSQTVSLGTAIGAWIQVDQATNIKVNSESAYMTLPSGFSDVIMFE